MSRNSRRREVHEEHDEGAERWLVTYADMLTLLMVLFIIMFAMSTVDDKKYQALKSGLAAGFGHTANILDGQTADITEAGQQATDMSGSLENELSLTQKSAVAKEVAKENQAVQERASAAAQAEVDDLTRLWSRIHRALAKQGLADDVQAQIDERGLVISLVSRHIVFQPNLADLTARGQQILNTLAPALKRLTEPIEVDGHTNQVKVKPKYYATDWDLSSARAIAALRWLNEHNGLPAGRLSATGFGHTKPLIDPKAPGSQDINKRVDIIVLSQAPAETREKFNQVQNSLKPVYSDTQGGTS
ncbi:flagellar motor protein MotB [Nocardioides sp. Kera G14]|uniref:OmpA/MotB family protein n=1 Tax=Nocardioides sp. Kera G14 TaxID=2884264 RepID=UPI001D11135F|nr:flagellar motor protein MotB [Nocardioides sp. Kera G14]UDY24059.1 flagellar motor protein MotB [Nocardioides sp. Kera G14]